jgi:hypothetical protein
LSLVGRIGQGFGVTDHAGGKDDLWHKQRKYTVRREALQVYLVVVNSSVEIFHSPHPPQPRGYQRSFR